MRTGSATLASLGLVLFVLLATIPTSAAASTASPVPSAPSVVTETPAQGDLASSGCGSATGFATTVCATIDYQNFSLPAWPGSFYFENQSGTRRSQDGIVTSMLVPWHQQSIFYVNRTRTLVGYDTATQSVRNLTQWQTNFTSPTDVLLFNYFQNPNGTLGALYQVGNPTFSATNPRACFWWVQLYDLENGTYYDENTTVSACSLDAGWYLNGLGELYDATGMVYNLTQGWVIFGQNTYGRMYAFNIYTGILVSTDSLAPLSNQGNSFVYVPNVNQIVEDNNEQENETVEAGAVYLSLAGASTEFHERLFWSPPCTCIAGGDTNNIPYFFWKLSPDAVELWEIGSGNEHSEVMILNSDAAEDSFPYVNATPFAAQDVATAAQWSGTGLGLVGSVCYGDAANGLGVLDALNAGDNWFNRDFCKSEFGFHGSGWLTPPSVYVTTNGTYGSLMYGGYLDAGLAEGSQVLVYNLSVPVSSAPTNLRATVTTPDSVALAWANPSAIVADDEVAEWTGTSCSGSTTGTVDLGGNDSSFDWSGLAPDRSFSFEVAAATAAGYGPYSSCLTGNTTGLPDPPTSVVASSDSATSITWSWSQSNIPGVVNDTLYLFSDSGCSDLLGVTSADGAVSSLTVGSLLPSTVYYAAVTAWNSTGQTVASGCAGGTTSSQSGGGPEVYSTAFSEGGLPSAETWYINVSGGPSLSATGATVSLATNLPNGTYAFAAATDDSGYAPNYYSGEVTVEGGPANANPIAFSRVTYPVTFDESGLPSGTSWSVTLAGVDASTTAATIGFDEGNGSYSFSVASSNRVYAPTQYDGTAIVSGSGVVVPVSFLPVTYEVSFTESGLPAGATWYVNLTEGAALSATGATTTLSLSLTNGTYPYSIATNEKYYAPSYSQASVSVTGAPVGAAVGFGPFTRSVTFTEKGLASGTSWTVTIGAQTLSTSGTELVFEESNGTYDYTASLANGGNFSGGFSLDGTAVGLTLQFYKVSFPESGLPSGTSWQVTVNGATIVSTSATVVAYLMDGEYAYDIGIVSGYHTTDLGSLTVAGTTLSIALRFAKTTYSVKFTESGLDLAWTNWCARFNAVAKCSDTSTISWTGVVNGTYDYLVDPVTNYSMSGSGSGTVTVAGAGSGETALTFASHFKLVTYKVTVKETGLPKGTEWSATLDGVTKSATSGTISFTLPNGTYDWSAGSSGYPTQTGSVAVDGAARTQTVTFG